MSPCLFISFYITQLPPSSANQHRSQQPTPIKPNIPQSSQPSPSTGQRCQVPPLVNGRWHSSSRINPLSANFDRIYGSASPDYSLLLSNLPQYHCIFPTPKHYNASYPYNTQLPCTSYLITYCRALLFRLSCWRIHRIPYRIISYILSYDVTARYTVSLPNALRDSK